MDMFAIQFQGVHGSTVISDTPLLDGRKQRMWLIFHGHKDASITQHPDGSVTVHADGLEDITFSPDEETKALNKFIEDNKPVYRSQGK